MHPSRDACSKLLTLQPCRVLLPLQFNDRPPESFTVR